MTFEEYVKQTKTFFSELFSLQNDKANENETVAQLRRGVEFKGINVWILIFAIFIASIGLNVNSTAVIIGAMLISPLMGPIMGVGLSLGIYDFELLKKSVKNLSVMVVLSILSSALYFLISPLNDAQSELIARTTPTIWDVFIALFGGLAGIVAGSSNEKGNVIPGVAIATALMPPLCTAGYGLANFSAKFFFGGAYLFMINTTFIALTTYTMVRFLGYKKRDILDPVREKRVNWIIPAVALLTIIPSVFLAVNLVRENVVQNHVNQFLKEEFNYNRNQIISSELKQGINKANDTLVVFLIGNRIDGNQIELLEKKLKRYQGNLELEIRQNLIPEQKIDFNVLKTDVMKDLYKNNEAILKDKDAQIEEMQKRILDFESDQVDIVQISKEANSLFEGLDALALKQMMFYDIEDSEVDTVMVALVGINRPKRGVMEKLEVWLKSRLDQDSVVVQRMD